MKIGLNATCFNNRPSGARQRFIGIYSELARRLANTEFVVYEPVDCQVGAWFDEIPNVSARHTPLPSQGRASKFFAGLRYWRSALSGEGFDVFEAFNQPLIKAPTGRTVLTIHDIRRMRPESGGFEKVVYKAVLRSSLKAADQVITVSEAMKEEILAHFPDIPISVVYNGLETGEFSRVSESDLLAVRSNYALPEEFLLSVGHFEERKNHLRLIDCIARLRDQGCSCYLLIVGNDSGELKTIKARVMSSGLSNNVKILTGLSDLEVRCVYKLCSLFVFPSSYEGFGIPILEAMAAGRPMVLSDLPVFREITEDRGVYFQYDNVEAMAFAIEKVLSSKSERSRLVAYGNERVKAFSFHKLAEQIEQLYISLT